MIKIRMKKIYFIRILEYLFAISNREETRLLRPGKQSKNDSEIVPEFLIKLIHILQNLSVDFIVINYELSRQ